MSREIDTLYYDGRCPLCIAEMSRLAAHRPDHLALKDIHQLALDEVTKHRMLKAQHLKAADGSFKVRLEANIAAWEDTRWG
jgi:predicted DCC family thiol-disulfide oxidoreductase YuxK